MKTKLSKRELQEARRALQEAIDKIGGPKKVGALCGGISGQAVSQWDITPKDHVLTVSGESGVEATRLRPDLYPNGTVLPELRPTRTAPAAG